MVEVRHHYPSPCSNTQHSTLNTQHSTLNTHLSNKYKVWVEHMDGRVVLTGTASAGLQKSEMETTVSQRIGMIKPVVEGELLWVR